MSELRFDWYSITDAWFVKELAGKLVDHIESTRTSTRGVNAEVRRAPTLQIGEHVLIALYYAHFKIPSGNGRVSFPSTNSLYSPNAVDPNKIPYSSTYARDVRNALLDLGWIAEEKGIEGKGYTRIWAVGQLSLQFDAFGMQWLQQQPRPKDGLIVLRDRDTSRPKTKKGKYKKITLLTPDTEAVRRYQDWLYNYNNFLTHHCIALDLQDDQLTSLAQEMADKAGRDKEKPWSSDGEDERVGYIDFSQVQLRRIFARGSMKLGGRFYGGWWQSIPALYRPHITIDGKMTCEVDYGAVSIRILYAQKGIQLPLDADPYDIGLVNWTGRDDPRRKPVKEYLNAAINDESGLFRLKQNKQELLGVSHEELSELVLQRHEAIADQLQSGAGLDTQFIDSQIAEQVMDHFMKEDIPVLPIHDSFIIRVGFQHELQEVMLQAFEKTVQAIGTVDTDSPRTSDYFGMNKADLDVVLKELNSDPANNIVNGADLREQLLAEPTLMQVYLEWWRHWCDQRGGYLVRNP